jgi:hypothetical protein
MDRKSAHEQQKVRLALALRQNLQRRKHIARARDANPEASALLPRARALDTPPLDDALDGTQKP